MTFCNLLTHSRRFIAYALFAVLLVSNAPQASANDHSLHSGHEAMSMAMHEETQVDASQQSKLLADKKESEFNHHLAGFFVILAGLFILAEGTLSQRGSFLRFAWPSCFLLSGLFLLAFSDTELWPFGPQSWWYGLTHNPEDLQHKTFAVILLTLGGLEIQRARSVLKSAWAIWVFPALALFGSVMLLFHEHHGGMHGADHMMVMNRIQAQHLRFAIVGGGVGIVKGLSELRTRWRAVFIQCWPLLLII